MCGTSLSCLFIVCLSVAIYSRVVRLHQVLWLQTINKQLSDVPHIICGHNLKATASSNSKVLYSTFAELAIPLNSQKELFSRRTQLKPSYLPRPPCRPLEALWFKYGLPRGQEC